MKITPNVKVVNLAVAFVFLFTSTTYSVPRNLLETRNGTSGAAAQSETLLSFYLDPAKLIIPENFGSITERFTSSGTANSKKIIIQIQDSHCNYEAQTNIWKIVETMSADKETAKSLKLIATEGAKGLVDPSFLRSFPDPKIRQEASDYFVKIGWLTGTEMYAINFKDQPLPLWGIEDKALYDENLEAFRKTKMGMRKEKDFVEKLSKAVDLLKLKVFSKDIRALVKMREDWDKNAVQFTEYCSYIDKLAAGKIPLINYPNFTMVIGSMEIEKKIDPKKIDGERQAMINELQKKMVKEELSELVKQSLFLRTGKSTSDMFYAYLKDASSVKKLDLSKYPNLAGYMEIVFKNSKVNAGDLFEEVDRIEKAIKAKMYVNAAEQELDGTIDQAKVLKNLLDLRMTRRDLTYYEAHKDELSPAAITRKLIHLNKGGEGVVSLEALSKDLDFSPCTNFYDAALKRDKVLVENTIIEMEKRKATAAAFVTGGFHTQGSKELFKAKGYSYVVVTPRMTAKYDDKIYLSRMLNEQTAFDKLFSNSGNHLAAWSLLDTYKLKEAFFAYAMAKARGVKKDSWIAVLSERKDISPEDLKLLMTMDLEEVSNAKQQFFILKIGEKEVGEPFILAEKGGIESISVSLAARSQESPEVAEAKKIIDAMLKIRLQVFSRRQEEYSKMEKQLVNLGAQGKLTRFLVDRLRNSADKAEWPIVLSAINIINNQYSLDRYKSIDIWDEQTINNYIDGLVRIISLGGGEGRAARSLVWCGEKAGPRIKTLLKEGICNNDVLQATVLYVKNYPADKDLVSLLKERLARESDNNARIDLLKTLAEIGDDASLNVLVDMLIDVAAKRRAGDDNAASASSKLLYILVTPFGLQGIVVKKMKEDPLFERKLAPVFVDMCGYADIYEDEWSMDGIATVLKAGKSAETVRILASLGKRTDLPQSLTRRVILTMIDIGPSAVPYLIEEWISRKKAEDALPFEERFASLLDPQYQDQDINKISEALGKNQDVAIPLLLERLRSASEDMQNKKYFIGLLDRMLSPQALGGLIDALGLFSVDNSEEFEAGMQILQRCASNRLLDEILKEDPFRNKSIVAWITSCFKKGYLRSMDSDTMGRVMTKAVFGEDEIRELVALYNELDDVENLQVKKIILTALGGHLTDESLRLLISESVDPSTWVGNHARDVLFSLDPAELRRFCEADPDVKKRLWTVLTREIEADNAAELSTKLDSSRAAPLITGAFIHRMKEGRPISPRCWAVMKELAEKGKLSTEYELIDLLGNKLNQKTDDAMAMEVLGAIGTPQCVELLIHELHDRCQRGDVIQANLLRYIMRGKEAAKNLIEREPVLLEAVDKRVSDLLLSVSSTYEQTEQKDALSSAFKEWLMFTAGPEGFARTSTGTPLDEYLDKREEITGLIVKLRGYLEDKPDATYQEIMAFMGTGVAGLSLRARIRFRIGVFNYIEDRQRMRKIIAMAQEAGIIAGTPSIFEGFHLSGYEMEADPRKAEFVKGILGFVPSEVTVYFLTDTVHIVLGSEAYARARYRASNQLDSSKADSFDQLLGEERLKFSDSGGVYDASYGGRYGELSLKGIVTFERDDNKAKYEGHSSTLMHEWLHKFFHRYAEDELAQALQRNPGYEIARALNNVDKRTREKMRQELIAGMVSSLLEHYQNEMMSKIIDGQWTEYYKMQFEGWFEFYMQWYGGMVDNVLKNIHDEQLREPIKEEIVARVRSVLEAAKPTVDSIIALKKELIMAEDNVDGDEAQKRANRWVATFLQTIPATKFGRLKKLEERMAGRVAAKQKVRVALAKTDTAPAAESMSMAAHKPAGGEDLTMPAGDFEKLWNGATLNDEQKAAVESVAQSLGVTVEKILEKVRIAPEPLGAGGVWCNDESSPYYRYILIDPESAKNPVYFAANLRHEMKEAFLSLTHIEALEWLNVQEDIERYTRDALKGDKDALACLEQLSKPKADLDDTRSKYEEAIRKGGRDVDAAMKNVETNAKLAMAAAQTALKTLELARKLNSLSININKKISPDSDAGNALKTIMAAIATGKLPVISVVLYDASSCLAFEAGKDLPAILSSLTDVSDEELTAKLSLMGRMIEFEEGKKARCDELKIPYDIGMKGNVDVVGVCLADAQAATEEPRAVLVDTAAWANMSDREVDVQLAVVAEAARKGVKVIVAMAADDKNQKKIEEKLTKLVAAKMAAIVNRKGVSKDNFIKQVNAKMRDLAVKKVSLIATGAFIREYWGSLRDIVAKVLVSDGANITNDIVNALKQAGLDDIAKEMAGKPLLKEEMPSVNEKVTAFTNIGFMA